jgi:3-hydroxyisobutyrate dehydrogenase-like beta-hydroxyacid dehydrogenase
MHDNTFMTHQRIGILHPGDMGISIAASAMNAGHAVSWASEGRSAATRSRAEQLRLHDAGSLAALCAASDIIFSVCPPHAAEDLAGRVLAAGFRGLYVDANAIAPQRMGRIGAMLGAAGIASVDGGIIGGPAWTPNSTWLYLSGPRAGEVAALFSAGPLETLVLGPSLGTASALKMTYAAYSKGTTALLCAVLAAADALNVREALQAHWARDGSGLDQQAAKRVQGVTAKAWRFTGEMAEIAATFAAAGLPGEFHAAAAEVYGRMAQFKDAAVLPELDEILRSLQGS